MYIVKNDPLYHSPFVGVLILYYHAFLPERLKHVCGCGPIILYLLRFLFLFIFLWSRCSFYPAGTVCPWGQSGL